LRITRRIRITRIPPVISPACELFSLYVAAGESAQRNRRYPLSKARFAAIKFRCERKVADRPGAAVFNGRWRGETKPFSLSLSRLPCASLALIFDFSLQPIVPSGLLDGATHARTTYRCTGKRRCFPITAPVSDVRVPSSATGYHGPSRAICEFVSALRDRRAFRARQLIGGIYDIQRDGPSRMSDIAPSLARENRTSVLFAEKPEI